MSQVDAQTWQVLIQESLGGLYARADQYVYRLNPGESAEMRFYATRYGSPIASSPRVSHAPGFLNNPASTGGLTCTSESSNFMIGVPSCMTSTLKGTLTPLTSR
jgi:hypothetical protein